MTDAEKDAAWRSLPEDFKRKLRCDYTTAESALSLDPTNVRIEAHKKFLEMYFGKHNLTATEEQEPPLKATAAEGLIQMAKDEMGIVDNDTPQSGTPDWLAYRMELAKEVAAALIRKGHNIAFVAESSTLIVDGIVERLKGGEK